MHLLLGFDDRWLAKTLVQVSAHWYWWKNWLTSTHCSQKTFYFFSVSNGPTSILSDHRRIKTQGITSATCTIQISIYFEMNR